MEQNENKSLNLYQRIFQISEYGQLHRHKKIHHMKIKFSVLLPLYNQVKPH